MIVPKQKCRILSGLDERALNGIVGQIQVDEAGFGDLDVLKARGLFGENARKLCGQSHG